MGFRVVGSSGFWDTEEAYAFLLHKAFTAPGIRAPKQLHDKS